MRRDARSRKGAPCISSILLSLVAGCSVASVADAPPDDARKTSLPAPAGESPGPEPLPQCDEREPAPCTTCDDLGIVPVGALRLDPTPRDRYRIVFVPVGHPDAALEDFADRVKTIADELRRDRHGIVGRRPELFEFHRALRPMRSSDGSWPCLRRHEGTTFESVHVPAKVTSAILGGLAGRSVLVEVMWKSGGTSNADDSRELGPDERVAVRLAAGAGASSLDHELGHAVIGLEDEYVRPGATGCYPNRFPDLPPGAPQPHPNLSPHADGRDWKGLVDGAEIGGGAWFDSCVYHPTTSCRMIASATEKYCPVCDRAIDLALGRTSGEVEQPDGSPGCVVTSTREANALHVRTVAWSYRRALKVHIRWHWADQTFVFRLSRQLPHLLDRTAEIPLGELLRFPVEIECHDGSGIYATRTIEE